MHVMNALFLMMNGFGYDFFAMIKGFGYFPMLMY